MVTIHCGHCNGSFSFEHPSVRQAKDMVNVTLSCEWCSITLKAPTDELHMIPISDFIRRATAAEPKLTIVPNLSETPTR